MICCTSRVSRSLSVLHPAGEPLDRLRVVGGVAHRLGEQPDRADRGLELVADVGDEVAADRLDPALAGAVLDEGQHQPGAQRRDPGGDVPRRQVPGRVITQLGLADLAVAAYLADQLGELLGRPARAAHQPEGVRRRGGLEHHVVVVDDDGAAAQHREHGRDAGGHGGLLDRGRRCCWRSLTRHASTAPPATTAPTSAARAPASSGPRPDRTQPVTGVRSARARRSDCSPLVHRADPGWSPGAAYAPAMRNAFHEQLDSIFDDLVGIAARSRTPSARPPRPC